MLKDYLDNLQETLNRGDAREESFYEHLKNLVIDYANHKNQGRIDITILPKQTEAGNPDFRIWNGRNHIIGYIEAKLPTADLNYIEETPQLKRYRDTFPNVILTNFYEFRLYRNNELIKKVVIGRYPIAEKLQTAPPVENEQEFYELLDIYFSFSLPSITNSHKLAYELAKRTRFLCDEVITIEMIEEERTGKKAIRGFYEAFAHYLIHSLTEKSFADLYSQTITYGLFAARSRANGEFTRELAYSYIPRTIGILRDLFRFISLEDPPKPLQVIVDDIAEVLNSTEVNQIFNEYYEAGKGEDPIIHFYETFLSEYDPTIREKRGVYYTPEPVVNYIVRSVHQILKSHFKLYNGLADNQITLLDPAAGTLTFPAAAIKLATEEFVNRYGRGGTHTFIKKHILENYYAFELMMAPYAVGHLKIGFVLEELGYHLADDERFKLYLTNTLDNTVLEHSNYPLLRSMSEESDSALKIKTEQPLLVIIGNPPYSGISENMNEFTDKLLKEDYDGMQSYYKVNDKPLGEKKLWLQDDYVKFLRFAQWKIHKTGYGVVGMITNHSYLDNPTFRGMRQSLMKTYNEIYIINLHGNSLKKEINPDGGKDENIFDIRQGVAITIFVKEQNKKGCEVFYRDLYGTRESKFDWLEKNELKKENYVKLHPESPWYFFIPRNIEKIKHYLRWEKLKDIFPINVTGIITARDNFVIDFDRKPLQQRISQFRNLKISDDMIRETYKLKDTRGWSLVLSRKKLAEDQDWDSYFRKILYRPFDIREIYYSPDMVDWPRPEVMRHFFNGGNIGLISIRRSRNPRAWNYAFVSNKMIAGATAITSLDINYFYPLYTYPDKNYGFDEFQHKIKKPNIDPILIKSLSRVYGTQPTPEDIFAYIYAVLYSNIYREKYEEFLKMDFPRIPFTADYELFKKMAEYGNQLIGLHLLNSPHFENPISRFQGSIVNDKIEKIVYNEDEKRIYINKENYFDNVEPEVWNYYVGGYQVLQKYLKDRKGRHIEDAPLYCQIITAISKTIELQNEIDDIYLEVEKDPIPSNPS